MKTISIKHAGDTLNTLLADAIAETISSHEPIEIVDGDAVGILLSAEDYRSIVETSYIHSIPGLAESIVASMNAPSSEFSKAKPW